MLSSPLGLKQPNPEVFDYYVKTRLDWVRWIILISVTYSRDGTDPARFSHPAKEVLRIVST